MSSRSLALLGIALAVFVAPARSEVIHKAPNGFHIRIVAEVDAGREKAYGQFLRIGEWWDSDHTWFGDAAGLSLEPQAGGCFCESSDDKSSLHMLVSHVVPGHEIRMVGGLGPLQAMGLHGAMSFSFETLESGGTRITQEYRVTGHTEGGLQNLADIVDRVQTQQVERLSKRLSE